MRSLWQRGQYFTVDPLRKPPTHTQPPLHLHIHNHPFIFNGLLCVRLDTLGISHHSLDDINSIPFIAHMKKGMLSLLKLLRILLEFRLSVLNVMSKCFSMQILVTWHHFAKGKRRQWRCRFFPSFPKALPTFYVQESTITCNLLLKKINCMYFNPWLHFLSIQATVSFDPLIIVE